MEPIRIQKWLSQMGIASRREAETWISEGRISINGKKITEQGTKIIPGEDKVEVNGKVVSAEPPPRVYWMLHKPDEVLTTRQDDFQRTTIYDLPMLKSLPFLIAPVGRLDYRTEGLLLLTNDGELANRLCHPKYKVPRFYHVLVNTRLTPEEETAIKNGVKLDDGMTLKTQLSYAEGKNLGASKGSWYRITVFEGRNRLVRRLFEHFNHKVVKLIRVGFGDIVLPEDLKPGEYTQLKSDQIKMLKDLTGLK
jgi:23S rRNA pseudouridine2605 synthase